MFTTIFLSQNRCCAPAEGSSKMTGEFSDIWKLMGFLWSNLSQHPLPWGGLDLWVQPLGLFHHASPIVLLKVMIKPLLSRCLETLVTINNTSEWWKNHLYTHKWTLFLLGEEKLTCPKCWNKLVGAVGIVSTNIWAWVDAKPFASHRWMGWDLREKPRHDAAPGSVSYPLLPTFGLACTQKRTP